MPKKSAILVIYPKMNTRTAVASKKTVKIGFLPYLSADQPNTLHPRIAPMFIGIIHANPFVPRPTPPSSTGVAIKFGIQK